MGEIVKLMDGLYSYTVPKMPDEKDIWYYDVPKRQQYWKTPYANNFKWLNPKGEILNVKQMKEKDKQEYITYFRQKWVDGLWFMNNGEPTYITGLHLDHLLFNKFSVGYLKFLEGQKLRFYFRELTDNDPLCDGRVWEKPRRAGVTFEQRSEAIRCVLSGYGFNVGMQSTKDEVCQRTLMKPIIDAYLSRPIWMREKIDMPNGRKPKKMLELVDSIFRDTGDQPESLGGYIRGFPTTATAFDSDAWMLLVIDEFSKHETQNPRESLDIGKKACSNPGRQGKVDCLSTCGDSKDAVKATMEWHRLISESNPKNRDANGKTVSGLQKYFIDATESFYVAEELRKQGKENTDIYGHINREMTEEWIWNEHRKFPVGSKDYIFSLYKLPLKEEHVLLSSSTSNIFSKPRINDALTHLDGLLPYQKPYVRGILDEDFITGKVRFVSDAERQREAGDEIIEQGIWLIAVHPYFSIEKGIDTRNRWKKINGVYFPYINIEGAIGYDPINFSRNQTTSSHLSDAAIVVFNKFNYHCPTDDPEFFENGMMALCLYEPDDPRDANAECIKASKYWGYPVMHEKSVNHVYEDFDAANMLPFLMKYKDKYGITPSDALARRDGIAMLKSWYASPKTPEEKDHIAKNPFEVSLRNLYNFDPENTTPFNVTMAELYGQHGLKQIEYTNLTETNSYKISNVIHQIVPIRN